MELIRFDKNNRYSVKINDSKYLENINEDKSEDKEYFNDISHIFISKYELEYNILSNNEKTNYSIKKKIEISEKIYDYLNNYNKKFSEKIISSGLQSENMFSSILFMNDFYKCNLIIYNKDTNKFYKTGVKEYEKIYCIFKNNKWYHYEEDIINDIKFGNINELKNIITMDIDTNMIYNLYLNPISKYKICDLIKICNDNDINVINDNGKKLLKKELYDKINMYKLIH